MEPGHLLHWALTCPSSANAWRLKSRHPFVPTAQQLISSFGNNNIHATHLADHQWNAEGAVNPTRLPDAGTQPLEWPSLEEPGSNLTVSSLELGVSAHVCTNKVWPPCGLRVWCRRTNCWPCCPSMSSPLTSAWSDGSGRWDNRMASEHLPRELAWPSSG